MLWNSPKAPLMWTAIAASLTCVPWLHHQISQKTTAASRVGPAAPSGILFIVSSLLTYRVIAFLLGHNSFSRLSFIFFYFKASHGFAIRNQEYILLFAVCAWTKHWLVITRFWRNRYDWSRIMVHTCSLCTDSWAQLCSRICDCSWLTFVTALGSHDFPSGHSLVLSILMCLSMACPLYLSISGVSTQAPSF